jgi:hypothetical protein
MAGQNQAIFDLRTLADRKERAVVGPPACAPNLPDPRKASAGDETKRVLGHPDNIARQVGAGHDPSISEDLALRARAGCEGAEGIDLKVPRGRAREGRHRGILSRGIS